VHKKHAKIGADLLSPILAAISQPCVIAFKHRNLASLQT